MTATAWDDRERLAEEAMMTSGGPARPSDRRPAIPAALVAVAVVLLVGLASGAAWVASRPSPDLGVHLALEVTPAAGRASGSVQRLRPLDPVTLADRAGPLFPPIADPDLIGWRLSADGSTLVYTTGRMLVVVDGRSGAERARFPWPYGSAGALSQDGSRLVVEVDSSGGRSSPAWQVVDTADGRPLARLTGAAIPPGAAVWLDPAARRLYGLPVEDDPAATGPRPVRLVAYDLTTGALAGEVALPEVLAGAWPTGRALRGEPVWARLEPGLAIAPDGRRLAIAHADRATVTLIDAERLTIERTFSLRPRSGWRDWLPWAPAVAAAKGLVEGASREAVFAPDGQHLYLSGGTWTIDEQAPPGQSAGPIDGQVYQGFGLTLVDLTSGQIMAEALAGEWLTRLLPTPDGRSVYVYGSGEGEVPAQVMIRDQAPYHLRRLDGTTLVIQAERTVPGFGLLHLRPTAPK